VGTCSACTILAATYCGESKLQNGTISCTTTMHRKRQTWTRLGTVRRLLVEQICYKIFCACDLIHPCDSYFPRDTPLENTCIYTTLSAINKLSIIPSLFSPFVTGHCNRPQHVISTVSRRNQRRGKWKNTLFLTRTARSICTSTTRYGKYHFHAHTSYARSTAHC
jgi:hypothetical protein